VSPTLLAALLTFSLGARMPRGLPDTGDPCKDSCTFSQQVQEKKCAQSAKESKTFDEQKCREQTRARFTPCVEGCRRMMPIAEEKMREAARDGGSAKAP
jgi:hypothetical protein